MIPEERRYLPKPIRYYALPLLCIGVLVNIGLKYKLKNVNYKEEIVQPEIVTTREKDKKGRPEGVHEYPSIVEQYEHKRASSAHQVGLV